MTVIQSHGGSGKQALEVANGLEADVVTLALEGDVQVVADAGMIEDGFEDEFDQESSPYTSTIVFLVRKDNPKNIADWDDLLREDVGVITPNPKTSGGARWNYLAAWYYFESQGQSGEEITENMKTLYHNVLVLDSGARGATTTFAESFYRPSDPDVFSDYISTSGERVITELPADGKWIVDDIALTDIAHFGGWSEASAKHFADGGVFEAIHEQ